jgi:predicted nucleotidyltransferase
MVTIAALNKMLSSFYDELTRNGYQPTKMILFGSYVKGKAHADSDIDIAIWSPKYSGSISFDMEFLAPIKRNYPHIEIHTFAEEDDENSNPFIEEILKTGKVFLPEKPLVFL